MKILIGIIIGATLILSVKSVYADTKQWDFNNFRISRIQDGNVNCYMATYTSPASWENQVSLQCLKVK